MSHIETPPGHRFPWYVRLFLLNQRRRYGRELEPARLWGRSPRVFAGLSLLYGAGGGESSPIEPPLRTLVTVLVSQINWCAFCVDINSATGIKRGLTGAHLEALPEFESSALFDARTKAALAYAAAITHTGRKVDAGLMTRLKNHFSDDAIIELTALVAFQNLSSKFNAALDVAPQGFCNIPPPGSSAKKQG
ncbi:MAG: carboxymuconolactone decarboxylase family protein [Nitrosomonadales bacterium]|nr:carboxymuconolactone decarboxylase family protein [Nitrosomonadales bacterium]